METQIKRFFLRCRGCLSIMAVQADRPPASMRCAACQGAIEIMGQVRYQRIVKMEEHSACDLRCTMASGPSCDCQCGGKNHGSQIMVTVARDVGGIPRLTPPNPEKAIRIHGEWLRALSDTKARITKHFPQYLDFKAGRHVQGFDLAQAQRGERYMGQLLQAQNLKTHHARLSLARKINEKITDGAR